MGLEEEGREGEHIQVFSPHNGLHFFPRAVCINIPALSLSLRKYWFHFQFGEQTASKEGRGEVSLPSFHLFHGSWKVIAEQVVWKGRKTSSSSVEGTKEEKSNFGGGERATDISDTERGERFAPHSLLYILPRAQKVSSKK